MACFTKGQRRRLPRCEANNAIGQRCAFRGNQYVEIEGRSHWVCGCHATQPGVKAWTAKPRGTAPEVSHV